LFGSDIVVKTNYSLLLYRLDRTSDFYIQVFETLIGNYFFSLK